MEAGLPAAVRVRSRCGQSRRGQAADVWIRAAVKDPHWRLAGHSRAARLIVRTAVDPDFVSRNQPRADGRCAVATVDAFIMSIAGIIRALLLPSSVEEWPA